jgi:hypothetical protein
VIAKQSREGGSKATLWQDSTPPMHASHVYIFIDEPAGGPCLFCCMLTGGPHLPGGSHEAFRRYFGVGFCAVRLS